MFKWFELYSRWVPLTIKWWEAEWGGKVVASHGTTHREGVMVLFEPNLNVTINKTLADKNGRYILAETSVDETNIVFGGSIRLILDIMEWTKHKDIPGVAFFLDFEKAFDSEEWNYIQKCLEAINFGPHHRQWVYVFIIISPVVFWTMVMRRNPSYLKEVFDRGAHYRVCCLL